jgi:hypothetical protein
VEYSGLCSRRKKFSFYEYWEGGMAGENCYKPQLSHLAAGFSDANRLLASK